MSAGRWLTDLDHFGAGWRTQRSDLLMGSDGSIAAIEPASGRTRAGGLDCRGYLGMPGLVNAHFHSQSTLARGLNAGMEISQWGDESRAGRLQEGLFRWLDGGATDAEIEAICLHDYRALLLQGVTCIADSGTAERDPAPLGRALARAGLSGVIDADASFERLGSAPPGVRWAAHLPEEEDLTEAALRHAARIQAERAPLFLTHCLEAAWRRDKVYADWGCSTVALFSERGLLSPRVVLAHGVHLTGDDDDLVAAAGAGLVHCPISNLAGGECAPVARWLARKLPVALGTDFARTDMWEVIRAAWLLLKAQGGRLCGSAAEVLTMATAGGAGVLGLAGTTGSLEVGRAADIVLLDKTATALQPLIEQPGVSTAAYNVLMEGRAAHVQHVFARGRWVVQDGEVTGFDPAEAAAGYRKALRTALA